MDSKDKFYAFFTPKNPQKPERMAASQRRIGARGKTCENQIKEDLKVTIRCIPLAAPAEEGACVMCGEKSGRRVVFAKSY